MTAPFEKAVMLGYVVRNCTEVVIGLAHQPTTHAFIDPADELSIGRYATEQAAWEAADRHRMFGDEFFGVVREDVVAPLPPYPYETSKVAVLNTGHLKRSTMDALAATPLKDWPVSGGVMPYGFCIYAHEQIDRPDEIYGELITICMAMHKAGFQYILFDADADAVEHFPYFDDGEVAIPFEEIGR